MDYKTYEPSKELSTFIKCYWTLDAPKELKSEKQRIVSDGCMEMIFHYGDKFKQYAEDGSSIVQPKCFVFGQITLPLDIEPTGKTGIFSVRFHPGGFMPFSNVPVSSLENRAVSLTELFADEGSELENSVLNASTIEARINLVESFLLRNLAKPESIDRIVKSCIELIIQLNGQLSVGELSERLNVNRRHLERKFLRVIGLSPKQLLKIIRLQSTLKFLADKNFENLTSIAHEASYYDQAHFIKDFKEFTGLSPKKFFDNKLKMSALFIGS